MPSSCKAKKCLVRAVPQDVNTIYELGSGWGGLACSLAKKYPQAQIHAFEISLLPWLISLIRQKIGKYSNLKIYRKNFYKISLEDADVIICYLYPGAMQKLKKKFNRELKLSALIISNCFAVPGWDPDKILRVSDLWRSEILIYKVLTRKSE